MSDEVPVEQLRISADDLLPGAPPICDQSERRGWVLGLFRRHAKSDSGEAARQLALAFDGLEAEAQRRTAEKLQFLHTLVRNRYGSVGGFLCQPPDEQQSFLLSVDEAARSARAKGVGFEPYAMSATMLGIYLKALVEERTDPGTVQLAARVVDLLNMASLQSGRNCARKRHRSGIRSNEVSDV